MYSFRPAVSVYSGNVALNRNRRKNIPSRLRESALGHFLFSACQPYQRFHSHGWGLEIEVLVTAYWAACGDSSMAWGLCGPARSPQHAGTTQDMDPRRPPSGSQQESLRRREVVLLEEVVLEEEEEVEEVLAAGGGGATTTNPRG
ncbi:unnamed protein product [Merluccius merluccius]